MATATVNYSSTTDSTPITLTMPATSSTLTVGRQSTIITNVSNKFLDARVFGDIKLAASGAAAGTIAIYVFAPTKFASSSFNYPIATTTELGETDAAATFIAEQRNMLKLGAAITTTATNDQRYSFSFNVAPLFGGFLPTKWGLWLTHSAGGTLASASWIHYVGLKVDS